MPAPGGWPLIRSADQFVLSLRDNKNTVYFGSSSFVCDLNNNESIIKGRCSAPKGAPLCLLTFILFLKDIDVRVKN